MSIVSTGWSNSNFRYSSFRPTDLAISSEKSVTVIESAVGTQLEAPYFFSFILANRQTSIASASSSLRSMTHSRLS